MSRRVVKKRRRETNLNKGNPDKVILYFAVFLAIFGAIMIFDASVYQATTVFKDQFHFLKLQAIWLLLGSIPAILIYYWDYRKLIKISAPLLIVTVLLLIAVLVFGKEINSAKRWLSLGPIDIQPSEFLKVVLIIYLSGWLSKTDIAYKNIKGEFKKGINSNSVKLLVILGVITSLIVLQPDLGTAIIISITSFIMFLMAGEDKKHILNSIGIILFALPVAVLAAILEPYRLKRIQTFLTLLLTGDVADPQGSGYQMQQILIGIGSGGLLGKGFGQSRQRFGYLVENTAFTDSTFAIILEELGLIGGVILIFGWLLFLWRGLKIAQNTSDKQGKLLSSGITVWLVFQALINMAANIGLMPLTGIPSPFISYGGSSTLVTLIGIAILLNVSKYNTNNG